MKKDIIKIVVLIVLIVLLGGGIFFVVKPDVFSDKKDDVVENANQNNEETNENQEENNEEKLENQEKEEEPEKQEESKKDEPKQEEPKKEEIKKEETKPSGDKTNNDKTSNTGGNDTKNENTTVTPSKEDKPVVVDPTIPIENDTMTSLVCSIELIDEGDIPTKQVVTMSFYDSTKLPYSIIMTTYMNLARFYYTDSQIKELLNEIKDSAESIPGYEFRTWQTGSTIELSYSSSASSLRKYYPDEYKIGGELSYDVTKRDFIEQGYTCS